MLLIWAVTVFGFQFLLRGIQKPTPEKTLEVFQSAWPIVTSNDLKSTDYKSFLNSLVLVKGKNMVKSEDQAILSDAISYTVFKVMPDSIRAIILNEISEIKTLKERLLPAKDLEYLEIKTSIREKLKLITDISEPFSGLKYGTIEASILAGSLDKEYPASLNDSLFAGLPEIMSFYLTHNQSVLTNTKFLGFPFHYFYTAVFLLILFIVLCIVYNILIEWRLGKEGIVE